MTIDRGPAPSGAPVQSRLLPEALLALPVARLPLAEPLAADLRAHGIATVEDLLSLPDPVFAPGAWLGPTGATDLRAALGRLLQGGLVEVGEVADDWTTIQGPLLAALAEDERRLLRAVLGLDGEPQSVEQFAARHRVPATRAQELAAGARSRLHERVPSLLCRLRHEIGQELAAFDGFVDSRHVAAGSLLQALGRSSGAPQLGLRLAAFCFPHDLSLHRDLLIALSSRRFHRLERRLRQLAAPHRLPQPVDTLCTELATDGGPVPRGLVLHLLRNELHLGIELDEERGELAVPDPRSPAHRLSDLLAEHGQPMAFDDLVFAYRERFRRANPGAIQHVLRASPVFLGLGPGLWSLRAWHADELAAVAPLADKAARAVCTRGGKLRIAELLGDELQEPRTCWLVQDLLSVDPRVRLLGRGEACPATHTRSQVLEQLLLDFRRAAGDVVTSRFLQNQPASRRRLVARLLRENRLFVSPLPDRIDLLSNYPFNTERLQRLLAIVKKQLDQRTGYTQVAALKALVDRNDLGGDWLTVDLLTDVLRRHGPFEVLPGGLVARAGLGLHAALMRSARQVLRDARVPLVVDEILAARPDLLEFAGCLRDLLSGDPLVQTRDGVHFQLV